MKHKIIKIIFTDTRLDGTPQIKDGEKFWMLHLQVDHKVKIKGKEDYMWISKFYDEDKSKEIFDKIKEGEEYDFDYIQHGIYFNLLSLKDLEGNIIV